MPHRLSLPLASSNVHCHLKLLDVVVVGVVVVVGLLVVVVVVVGLLVVVVVVVGLLVVFGKTAEHNFYVKYSTCLKIYFGFTKIMQRKIRRSSTQCEE